MLGTFYGFLFVFFHSIFHGPSHFLSAEMSGPINIGASDDMEMESQLLPSSTLSVPFPAVSRATSTSTAPPLSIRLERSILSLQQLYKNLNQNLDLALDKIRILEITNIQEGRFTDALPPVIEARMRVVQLNSRSESNCFDAISYRWNEEPPQPEHRILLDPCCTCAPENTSQHESTCRKFEVYIRKNAYSAIYHIYHQNKTQAQKNKASNPLTIWLDELCINQQSQNDKAMQIPLMGKIYSSAQKTYFWIGEGNRQSDHAMDWLQNGLLPRQDRALSVIRCALALLHRLVWKRWLSLNEGLEDIANRDWINRVWTFQECLLSRNGYIVCGNRSIPWIAMVKSVIFYKTLHQRRLAPSPPEAWHSWMDLVEYWLESSQPQLEPELDIQTRSPSKPEHDIERTDAAEKQIEQYKSFVVASWKYYQILGAIFAVTTAIWCCSVVGGIFVALALLAHGGGHIGIGAVGVVLMTLVLIAWSRTAYLPEENLGWIKIPNKEAIVHEILRRNCGDSGDKYFGVHALLDAQTDIKRIRGKPLANIYQHLTITLLMKKKCLDMLLVGLYLKSNQTASWVIDWSSMFHDCRMEPDTIRSVKERLYADESGTCNNDFAADQTVVNTCMCILRMAKSQDVGDMQRPLRYANLLGAGGLWLGFRFYEQSQWSWLRGPRYRQFVRFDGPTPGSVSEFKWEEEDRKLVVYGCVVGKLKAVETNIPPIELKAGSLQYHCKSKTDLELGVSAFQRVMRGLKPTQLNMCVKYLLMISGHTTSDENVTAFAGQAAWLDIMTGSDAWSDAKNASKAVRRLQRAGYFRSNAKARPRCIQERLQGFVAATGVALARCEGSLFSGLGIACPIARENDRLALISGVSLPMVLRPGEREEYTVVGPAFFGGLMDGKVWNDCDRGLKITLV